MATQARSTTLTRETGETCVSSELLGRIRAEYREMPGLRLTPAQAARLWGLTPGVCAEVLQALVAAGVLTCTREVRYIAAVTELDRTQRPGAA
jgi:hypothetical protein